MSEEEIAILKKTVTAHTLQNDSFNAWMKAFGLYNENHEKKFNMGCASCYFKVLKYILDERNTDIVTV